MKRNKKMLILALCFVVSGIWGCIRLAKMGKGIQKIKHGAEDLSQIMGAGVLAQHNHLGGKQLANYF